VLATSTCLHPSQVHALQALTSKHSLDKSLGGSGGTAPLRSKVKQFFVGQGPSKRDRGPQRGQLKLAKCMFPRGHRPLEGPEASIGASWEHALVCQIWHASVAEAGRGQRPNGVGPCKRVLSSLCLGLLHRT